MSFAVRSSAALLAACSLAAFAAETFTSTEQMIAAHEEGEPVEMPTVTVEARRLKSLTAHDAHEARHDIDRTPGGVALVDQDEWRDTPARTLKDVLDYTPGVFVQPKWGEDARLSIRGSGLSRNFHLRSVQLLVDGIPMNAADGSADFQEIDPTAFAYTEVYKGANALRYGSNALGGAIHFVSPTGYSSDRVRVRLDAGSFGLRRAQLAGGAQSGAFDAHLTASTLDNDGFRDHSEGESRRGAANFGWRISPNVETRLYLLGADLDQRIPGSLTREQALRTPRMAAANNLNLDSQRNMQSWRVASKTTLRSDLATFEFGGYAIQKQLIHPIFQYLDYQYEDRGAFLRASFNPTLGPYANRLVIGANLFDGHIDNQQFQNQGGAQRGALLSASKDASDNLAVYAENQLQLRAGLSLIAGLQYLDARREREDRFENNVDTSGAQDYDFFNPKLGVLWELAHGTQVFANLSRSAEAPSFGELNFTNAALAETRAQRATTVEIGTRGTRESLSWDVAIYRAELRNEFQFFDLGGGSFSVTNADDTVHQGIEAGLDWSFAQNLFAVGDRSSLRLAYAFNDFFFDNDASWGNNELPGAPRHFLRGELRYAHASGAYVAPQVEWVPQGYDVDNANLTQTRDYALLGLRAGYEAASGWSVYVDARNLADTKYIASSSVAALASANSALFEPGDGRAIFGGLSFRW